MATFFITSTHRCYVQENVSVGTDPDKYWRSSSTKLLKLFSAHCWTCFCPIPVLTMTRSHCTFMYWTWEWWPLVIVIGSHYRLATTNDRKSIVERFTVSFFSVIFLCIWNLISQLPGAMTFHIKCLSWHQFWFLTFFQSIISPVH